jgi:hypothetical protein
MKKPYNPGSRFQLTSRYGRRIDPITGKPGEFHPGLDFGALAGTSIPAAEAGEVIFSGPNSGFGNVVIVRNDSGEYSLYGHMQPSNHVGLGQRVWPGDTIGRVGSTGSSSGNHLHYSVINKEAYDEIEKPDAAHNGGSIGVKVNEKNTIDPATYVPGDPWPYLDETRRAMQIMSGADVNRPAGRISSDPQAPFDDRFGNWGSAPASTAPPAASDQPESFDNRFGNWGTAPAGRFSDTRSPVLRALEKYSGSAVPDDSASALAQGASWGMPSSPPGRIGTGGVLGNYVDPSLIAPGQGALPAGLVSSGPIAPDLPSDEAAGSNPVRYVSGRIMGQPQASISNTGAQAAPSSSQVGGPPVGIFSGQPMLPFPLPPSFWRRRDDNRAPDDDEEERASRWLRLLSPQ